MLAPRIVACLDVSGGRVVKGDAVRRPARPGRSGGARRGATRPGRRGRGHLPRHLRHPRGARTRSSTWSRRTAERLFIPLTVGGGVRTVGRRRAGAAGGRGQGEHQLRRRSAPRSCSPSAPERFGAQCVVASIDARRDGDRWQRRTRAADGRRRSWTRWSGPGSARAARRGRDPAHQHRPRRGAHRLRPGAHPRGDAEAVRRSGGRLRRRGRGRAPPRSASRMPGRTRRWSRASFMTGTTTVRALKQALSASRRPGPERGVMREARSWMDAAEAVARSRGRGGAASLPPQGVTVETKGDGTPVTGGGPRRRSRPRAPGSRRTSPRTASSARSSARRGRRRARRWILDPIDGTKTFVRGVPLWGTLVARGGGGATSSRARPTSRRWTSCWSRRRARAACWNGRPAPGLRRLAAVRGDWC